jgi:hypothetical protein
LNVKRRARSTQTLSAFSLGGSPVYCAQCGAEYRAGFTECNTCLVPLVEGDAPEPLPDEQQFNPDTRLGSKGTRLVFLYLFQVFVIVVAVAFRGFALGPLPLIGALCGVLSAIGIFTRQRIGLYLVYAFLGILLLVSALNIVQNSQATGFETLVGQVVGGIFIPLAWFLYFYRRRNLFA